MASLTRRGFLGAAGLAAAGLAAGCERHTPTPLRETAWSDLRGSLRGTVLRPGDPGYPELATPRNLRFRTTMPEAVVLVTSVEDVAAALRWARKTNTPFAIRGGGHNYATASSSPGILISTRRMNAARIDGNTLYAEAGVLNSDLARLLPGGGTGRLLLPGGNCPAVGVAGLTFGGGIGPNAPWAGLTADRLRKATVVTADGGAVTAGATENPELFWGLRGGAGGNFGVVTDLEYELVEVPLTRATTVRLSVTGRDAAVTAAQEFQAMRATAPRTATGHLRMSRTATDSGVTIKAQVLGDEAAARELLAGALRTPGARADITERPWWDAYGWYVTEPKPAYSFWDRSLYAEDFLPGDAISGIFDVVSRFPAGRDPERYGSVGLFGWVGGAVTDVPADASAYVHRSARILVEMSAGWSTPDDDPGPVAPVPPDIRDWEDELWETIRPHTNGRSYQNFPDPELPDWATAYYGDNLARLTTAKATWDPGDVFTYSQAIPLPR